MNNLVISKFKKLFRLIWEYLRILGQFIARLFTREFIEKNSTYIGAGLIVLSLVGGTLLMVKKGSFARGVAPSENNDQKISELENKIKDLEQQITELKSTPVPAINSGELSSPSANSSPISGKININTATQAELESLPGIGPTYAKRIIEYRTANGGFKSIDQIKNVKGIGEKTYAKFSDKISI
ncbi:MAG: helix-hairpin-helix domain-containing protein [Patescibacteria group bacterium]|jgi:comEA protein